MLFPNSFIFLCYLFGESESPLCPSLCHPVNGSSKMAVILLGLVWSFGLSPLAQSLPHPRLEGMSSCLFLLLFSDLLTSPLPPTPVSHVGVYSGSVLWSRDKPFPWLRKVDGAVTVFGSDRHHNMKQLVPKGRSKLLP